MINVDEIKLYVIGGENTSSFHKDKVLVIKRERFNMQAQFLPVHFQKNGEWAHLQRLKLANINPNNLMVVSDVNVPEDFIQLDIRKGKEDQPLAIQTPFLWAIFGSSKKYSPTETKKVAVNTIMLTSKLELNDNVKTFWEFESKIAESINESDYSQDDVKCIKKLHQETKWLQGKYEIPMLWPDKVEELPNNFNATLQRLRSLEIT